MGAEPFEKELLAQRPAAQRSQAQPRLLALRRGLCPQATVETYLRGLADSDRSLTRQLRELLELFRTYRPQPIAAALEKLSPHAPSGPTTSPISCTRWNRRARRRRPSSFPIPS